MKFPLNYLSKKEILKLLSVFYILLVSFLLVIMATYAWSVISTAPQAGGTHMGIDASQWITDGKEGYTAQVGNRWYPTLTDALEAQGETAIPLTLINDVTEDVTVKKGQTVFLDLAGHSLTNTASDSITVEQGATLIISDTSAEKTGAVDNVTHGKAALFNNGNVEIYGGMFMRSQEASTSITESNGNSYYTIVNHGIMTIHDGKVISTGAYSSLIENGYYSYTNKNPRTGHVEGVNVAEPTLTIGNGEFIGGIHNVKNDDGGHVIVKGGTFSGFAQVGVFNANIAKIEGGRFSVGDDAAASTVYNCDYSVAPNLCQLEITGGSYDGNVYFGTSTVISGGMYTIDVSNHLKEGYEQVRLDENTDIYVVRKAEVA